MKRILLVLAIAASGCATGVNVNRNLKHHAQSKTVSTLVVAASVIGLGLVVAQGSQGPE